MDKRLAVELALEICAIDLCAIAQKFQLDPVHLLDTLSKDTYSLAKDLGISKSRATAISKSIIADKNPKHSAIYALLLSVGHKQCQKCKTVTVLEEFYPDATYCINCTKNSNNLWYDSNKEAKKVYNAEYQRQNRKALNASSAKRKAGKRNATPPWANLDKIREIYKNCPEGYHVDHIIPLRGTFISGLHIETNLQYLPALDNIRKSNKFDINQS